VELPRFEKSLDELDSLGEKWVWFLKHAGDLSVVPDELKEPEELGQALESARVSAFDEIELDNYEKRLFWLEDQKTGLQRMKEHAMKKGLEKGLEKGREEGRQEGREEGRLEGELRGRVSALFAVLAARGLALDEGQRARIEGCDSLDELDEWLVRAPIVESAAGLFE